MDSQRIHIVLLFVSFALAVTVLIDGVTHLSMAKSDFPSTPDGKVGWTNLMMYEIIVPVLSVFGLGMHIFGLHLDFVSYIPETTTEGLFLVIGTAAHGAAWLAIGSMWTACEVGTMKVRKVVNDDQELSILVSRGGPAFCPQHKFMDAGYSLEGPIPKIKVGLSWILFVLTLGTLFCSGRGWQHAKHSHYLEESARHRRTTNAFEMSSFPGRSATMDVLGTYETKV